MNLDEYVRHVELFGPDCVLETAAGDLNRAELGSIKAFIESKQRTHRFRLGRWEETRSPRPRQCEGCGLDLPIDAKAHRRFHDSACRMRRVRVSSAQPSKDPA